MITVFSVDVDTETREVTLNIGGNSYHIMQSDFDPSGIESGAQIDDALFEKVNHFDEKLRCVKQAFKLLSYSDCSSGRLAMKLKRNFSKSSVQETVDLLIQHEYLKDAELCAEYAHNNYEIKKHGPVRIRQDLFKLGFSSDVISNAMEEIECLDHSENLTWILETKFPSRDPQNTQKAFATLYRLGYPYDDVREAIENYFESEL